MAKELADIDPIYVIVADATDQVHQGYFISVSDYYTMIDTLNQREEALRYEKDREINQLKNDLAKFRS
jgi:hypothetical protein